jgi:nucleotide-binding universal stress UspA family protein
MTVLAPYDGSDLSRAAVRRAVEFADYRDEGALVLTVIPDDSAFAVQRGWAEEEAQYDPATVEERFRSEVESLAPEATFRTEQPDSPAPAAAVRDDVARTIRTVAADIDASILFIGSDNAGQVSTPADSVGSPISTDAEYDVHIVRTAD